MNEQPDREAGKFGAPEQTPGVLSMRERVSQRMFGIGEAQRLGRYLIERRLGSGGMGVVYEAFDEELSRRVAIKLVRGDRSSGERQKGLAQEARALARLSHPNVVQVYEVGTHEGQLYLVMEYVDGLTLERWAKVCGPARIRSSCIQAGRGLAAAHEAGLLHRDIKPNNIIVADDGRVRVLDFGLARAQPEVPDTQGQSGEETDASRLRGTPAYMAPELYEGRKPTARSDQFSFCVMIWQLLDGRRPFESEQLAVAVESGTLEPRGRIRPAWLRRALSRGLALDPDDRWPSLAALLDELETRPRRRAVSVVFSGIALGAGLLAASIPSPRALNCPEPAAIYAQTWDASRRIRLEGQLEYQGRTPVEIALVLGALDTHADRWIEIDARACEATRREETRSEVQLERALACLERGRTRAASVIEQLGRASGEDPRDLLGELGDPTRCLESGISVGVMPAPELLVDAVAERRAALDRASVRARVEPGAADDDSQRLSAEARELGFRPLLAEALALEGRLAAQTYASDRAAERSREALRLAKSLGDLDLEFRCLLELVDLTARQFEDPERVADLLASLFGTLDQLGRPPSEHGEALAAQARLEQLLGEHENAELSLRRALELHPDPATRDQLELRLANVLAERGEQRSTLALYEAIVVRRSTLLGPNHPSVAVVELNLGISRFELGELELALEHVEQALELQVRAYGEGASRIAPAHVLRAQILVGLGDIEGALAAVDRAWELERSLDPRNSERGNSLELERELRTALEDYAGALEVAQTIEREILLSELERAMNHQNIGWLACRSGAYELARSHFERALSYGAHELGLYAQIGLAELDLVEERPDTALARLEQILPELEAAPMNELGEGLAEARYWRLRAEQARRAPHERLAELTRELRETYAKLDIDVPKWIDTELSKMEREDPQ